MELQATMALDRDAVNTVTLRLLPPSTAASTSSTAWLLLHTIPITASLSRTLSRLVSVEEAAMAQARKEEEESDLTPPAASAAPQRPSAEMNVRIACTSSVAGGVGGVGACNGGATRGSASHRVRMRSTSMSSSASSSSSDEAAGNGDAHPPSAAYNPMTTTTSVAATGWLEFVRIGYIMSEIHAYCILFKCRTPAQAVRMKAALEEGAALGVTAPVEFVDAVRPVAVTRRVFAEVSASSMAPQGTSCDAADLSARQGGEDGRSTLSTRESSHREQPQTKLAESAKAKSDADVASRASWTDEVQGEATTSGQTSQQPRWITEVYAVSLLEAVTTIYPVRDGENTDSQHTCNATTAITSPSPHGEEQPRSHTSRRGASQLHSPYPHVLRRPHSDQALSAPASPSLVSMQGSAAAGLFSPTAANPSTLTTALSSTPPVAGATRLRGGVVKGAAPPLSRHSSHYYPATPTAAATASSPSASLRASPAHQHTSHHTHTPLHLPKPCSTETCTTPLRLDAAQSGALLTSSHPTPFLLNNNNHSNNNNSSSSNGHVNPNTNITNNASLSAGAAGDALAFLPGGLGEEFCAICQVDPLRSSACVTTLCQHAFHLHCYAQLPSSSAECPLCRFSVYDLLNDARCEVCGTYEDLWVCLICGHVACGRARRDHQQEHYRSSGHSCTWQSSTNRIWNVSSRMFLHQEVALLLDSEDAAAAAVEAAHDAEDRPADAAMDRLRALSWAEPMDSDLQEALNESKEEAVEHYYTEFLQQLAEEQRKFYEARLADQRRRKARRQWRAEAQNSKTTEGASRMHGGSGEESCLVEEVSSTGDSAVKPRELPPSQNLLSTPYASLHALLRDERRQRRCVLAEYAQATVDLLQQAQRAYTSLYSTLKSSRDDAQQQVLLRSHFNNGLVTQLEQVRQRTQEAMRNGEKSALAKSAEEAKLQKKVEEALSAL